MLGLEQLSPGSGRNQLAALGIQMGTPQVTAQELQGLGGRSGESQAFKKCLNGAERGLSDLGRAQSLQMIPKLVLGQERCTHDSQFSGAAVTE